MIPVRHDRGVLNCRDQYMVVCPMCPHKVCQVIMSTYWVCRVYPICIQYMWDFVGHATREKTQFILNM